MNELTPSDLLQVFSALMYTWSVFILGWGTIAGILFYRAYRVALLYNRHTTREGDKYVLWLIGAVNLFLTTFLLNYTPDACTSWIAVVNVFYTIYLLYVSVDAARWWKSIKRRYTTNPLTQQS